MIISSLDMVKKNLWDAPRYINNFCIELCGDLENISIM